MLKTIVGHFLGDRDTYMTTELSGINGCIPDRVMVSDYGSSPLRGELPFKGYSKFYDRSDFASSGWGELIRVHNNAKRD
jgi:hypothetical protein